MTQIESLEKEHAEFSVRQFREATAKPLSEELSYEIRQLQRLQQALLGRHLAKDPEVTLVSLGVL